MTLTVNTILKKPGVFTVAPVGALDADSPRVLEEKVFDILSALPSLNVFASVKELDDYLDAMQNAVRGQGGPA